MPRQKNRGQQYFFPTYQAPTRTRRWKMASYIRLSKEDLQKIKKGLDCSNSVKNQRDILNYFYETHAEEFESIREYVDDGHTGTDTDREHFQEMLSDIMSGKINCVVVKDLSRLARNYSDAGSLIDNLFVQMGILRSQVNISDLELIEEPLTVTAKQMRRTSSGKMKMGKSMHVSPEINLLGKTVDEAVAELDKYLDDAYIAHLSPVRIVHGKGTGALRNGIHQYLRRQKHIKSFRLGAFGEGDAGVTIVEFK